MRGSHPDKRNFLRGEFSKTGVNGKGIEKILSGPLRILQRRPLAPARDIKELQFGVGPQTNNLRRPLRQIKFPFRVLADMVAA